MNDTIRRKSLLSGRGTPLMRGPVLATVLFCLAYGSVMALIIAPRSLLTGGEDDLAIAVGTDQTDSVLTGQAVPQVLKAGYAPLSPGNGGRDGAVSTAYGITD